MNEIEESILTLYNLVRNNSELIVLYGIRNNVNPSNVKKELEVAHDHLQAILKIAKDVSKET